MKKIVLVFSIILYCTVSFPQDKTVFKLSVDNNFNKKIYPASLLAVDFTIDSEDNVYIADPFLSKLIRLDLNGNVHNEYPLPSKLGYSIATDTSNNIYILLRREYYKGIIKHSRDGKKIEKFSLDSIPQGYARRIFINNDNEICIVTFPPDVNPIYLKEGLIFVYNTEGKFLRRSNTIFTSNNFDIDNAIEDSKYYITTKEKSKINGGALKNKILISEINMNKDHMLIHCDTKNNAYLFLDNKITIFNFEKHSQKHYNMAVNGRMHNHIISSIDKYRVSKSGEIYYLGITNINDNINEGAQYSTNELYYSLKKITLGK